LGIVRAIRGFWRRKGPASRREALVIASACFGGFAVLALLLLAMGWVEGQGQMAITFDNRTAADVTVLVDERVYVTVKADHSETIGTVRSAWDHQRSIEIVDQRSGRLIYSASLSREDLNRMKNRIVISEQPADP